MTAHADWTRTIGRPALKQMGGCGRSKLAVPARAGALPRGAGTGR